MAFAFADSELSCFYSVNYVLQTHKNLTLADINYASNYIASFYEYGLSNPKMNQKVFSDKELTQFLVYANQSRIGMFALSYNDQLDFAIKNKNNVLLQGLLLGPRTMFIELYDNPFLSPEDQRFVLQLVNREFDTVTLFLNTLKENILQYTERYPNTFSCLNNECYNAVCLHDSTHNISAIMSAHETIPSSVFTVDKPPTSNTPYVCCFNILELLDAVTNPNPINPRTNAPFSSYTLKLINQRFHKELSMYQRYKQLRSVI